MTNKPTNKSVQTQEQAIQEAKDRVAKRYDCQNWQHFTDYHKNDKQYDIAIGEAILEYSSSQLEAKDREIERLNNAIRIVDDLAYCAALNANKGKTFLKKAERIEEALTVSESQLQQATASSGERGGGFRELFAWIEKMRSSPTKTQGELLSLFKKKLQSLSSEHTEVKEVVMGRNSSVTKSKWPESLKVNAPEVKEGEGREVEFESELFKLINFHVSNGLKKKDLVHKMKYVTESCEKS